MKTSTEYLKLAMEKLEKTSDAQAAKALGIARSTLSEYLSGRRIMDDFACVMVAKVLEIDPMDVIAACNQERERTEDRREFWRNFRAGTMRKEGGQAVVPILFCLAVLGVGGMEMALRTGQFMQVGLPPLCSILFLASKLSYKRICGCFVASMANSVAFCSSF